MTPADGGTSDGVDEAVRDLEAVRAELDAIRREREASRGGMRAGSRFGRALPLATLAAGAALVAASLAGRGLPTPFGAEDAVIHAALIVAFAVFGASVYVAANAAHARAAATLDLAMAELRAMEAGFARTRRSAAHDDGSEEGGSGGAAIAGTGAG